jgi:O-antigen ligase
VTHTVQSRVLDLALAWSLLAFGGVYPWALAPLTLAALVLLLAGRPDLKSSEYRLLDYALLAAVLLIGLQLVPLPRGMMAIVSPGTVRTWDALSLQPRGLVSISVEPIATIEALAICVTAVAVFWSARELFRFHGVRRAIRTIALAGAIASFAGLLQRKTGANLVYGFWQPLEAGAWPFGPFVNRNFFATWVVMGIPLCTGYLLARQPSRERRDPRPLRTRLAHALDGRAIWLTTAIGLMTVALFASLSRSGVVGLAAVAIAGWAGARLRPGSHRLRWAAAGLAVVGSTVVLWGDLPGLATRVGEGPRERRAIWRDTAPLIRDHWLVGTGAGAYARAMFLYQRTDRRYYDNQAHNQYLQIAADGGVLLVIPAVVAVTTLAAAGFKRLRQDTSGMFWVRLGAAGGLCGVLVQGLWETGLRAPANAVLSAVLAAILLHRPLGTGHTNRTAP